MYISEFSVWKLTEWCRFVTYLWNDPRIYCTEGKGNKTCYGDNALNKHRLWGLLWYLDIGTSIILDLLNVATTFTNYHADRRVWDNNFNLHTINKKQLTQLYDNMSQLQCIQ